MHARQTHSTNELCLQPSPDLAKLFNGPVSVPWLSHYTPTHHLIDMQPHDLLSSSDQEEDIQFELEGWKRHCNLDFFDVAEEGLK